MSSSFADAMIMASLLNNNSGSMFEARRNREPDFIDSLRKLHRYNDLVETTKEKKEKEKKKPEGPKMTYWEAAFWLFFLSPIIGPIFYNLENALIKSMH